MPSQPEVPELILHHYDMSPYAEKVRLMMGVKSLAWRSVQMPIVMPKPDLTELTGGYRPRHDVAPLSENLRFGCFRHRCVCTRTEQTYAVVYQNWIHGFP